MKRAVFIEGRRNGYHPDQCGSTMTVAELRQFLDEFSDDDEIYISNDNGYTYGSITCSSFESGEYDSDRVVLDFT